MMRDKSAQVFKVSMHTLLLAFDANLFGLFEQFEAIMQVVTQRLLKLQSKGNVMHLRAELLIKRRRYSVNGTESWEVVRARGHLDEVEALKAATTIPAQLQLQQKSDPLVLIEGSILGGGAFSRVSVVSGGALSKVNCPSFAFYG